MEEEFLTSEEIKELYQKVPTTLLSITEEVGGRTFTKYLPLKAFLNSTRFNCTEAKRVIVNGTLGLPKRLRSAKEFTEDQKEKIRKHKTTDWYPAVVPAYLPYDPWVLGTSPIFFVNTSFKDFNVRMGLNFFDLDERPAIGWPIPNWNFVDKAAGTTFGISMVGRPKSRCHKIVITATYYQRLSDDVNVALYTANSENTFFVDQLGPNAVSKWQLYFLRGTLEFGGRIAEPPKILVAEWTCFDELCGITTEYKMNVAAQNIRKNGDIWFNNGVTPTLEHKSSQWVLSFENGIIVDQRDTIRLEIGSRINAGRTLRNLAVTCFFHTLGKDCNQDAMTYYDQTIVH